MGTPAPAPTPVSKGGTSVITIAIGDLVQLMAGQPVVIDKVGPIPGLGETLVFTAQLVKAQ